MALTVPWLNLLWLSFGTSEAVKSWTEVLEHLCIPGAFFNLHNPFSHPKKHVWAYVCMQKFFEDQLCAGWMKQKLQENCEKEALSLFMRASRKYRKL